MAGILTNMRNKGPLRLPIMKPISFIIVLNGPETNVTQLRTTTPLFMAYEEVYSNLQTKMCPLFYKSEEASVMLL